MTNTRERGQITVVKRLLVRSRARTRGSPWLSTATKTSSTDRSCSRSPTASRPPRHRRNPDRHHLQPDRTRGVRGLGTRRDHPLPGRGRRRAGQPGCGKPPPHRWPGDLQVPAGACRRRPDDVLGVPELRWDRLRSGRRDRGSQRRISSRTVIRGIPTGVTCTAEEVNVPPQWSLGGVASNTVTITDTELITVHVVNTRVTGELTVVKAVRGAPSDTRPHSTSSWTVTTTSSTRPSRWTCPPATPRSPSPTQGSRPGSSALFPRKQCPTGWELVSVTPRKPRSGRPSRRSSPCSTGFARPSGPRRVLWRGSDLRTGVEPAGHRLGFVADGSASSPGACGSCPHRRHLDDHGVTRQAMGRGFEPHPRHQRNCAPDGCRSGVACSAWPGR